MRPARIPRASKGSSLNLSFDAGRITEHAEDALLLSNKSELRKVNEDSSSSKV